MGEPEDCPRCGVSWRLYADLVDHCRGYRAFLEEIAGHPDVVLTARGQCLLEGAESLIARAEGRWEEWAARDGG